MVILSYLLHQVNIKYDLNFSFLAIAAGRRGKEQTKEIQIFQLCFATIISLSPSISYVTFFFLDLSHYIENMHSYELLLLNNTTLNSSLNQNKQRDCASSSEEGLIYPFCLLFYYYSRTTTALFVRVLSVLLF